MAHVAHKTNECIHHIIIVHMLNVVPKRIKTSSRDVLMEETHMKDKYKTKNNELLFKGSKSQVHLPKLRQLA